LVFEEGFMSIHDPITDPLLPRQVHPADTPERFPEDDDDQTEANDEDADFDDSDEDADEADEEDEEVEGE